MASSDTSDSTSSEEKYRKRKSSKKHKHKTKSEKKHKKHKAKKEKKASKRKRTADSSSDNETPTKAIKVQIPALPARPQLEVCDAFGPALPPHLQQKQSIEETKRPLIGPTLPTDLEKDTKVEAATEEDKAPRDVEMESGEESDEHGTYGPMPTSSGMSGAQIELEQRALQLKIAAIDGDNNSGPDQQEREEWMLELPEVGLKSGLAALSNMKRTFYQGKERPDFSDRSSWTKTPNSDGNAQKASSSKSAANSLRDSAQQKYDRERDAEQERIAKKLKKKHKREESLVELHQKKLRKEQKKREKELAASGTKPERRPFSRDVDLKLNKIDSNQTKQIVDKAKILNTKFATGHTKYL